MRLNVVSLNTDRVVSGWFTCLEWSGVIRLIWASLTPSKGFVFFFGGGGGLGILENYFLGTGERTSNYFQGAGAQALNIGEHCQNVVF